MNVIPDSYFDRFTTPKYRNRNPLQRLLIRRFVASVRDLMAMAAPRARVLEVGCGEGFLSGQLAAAYPGLSFTGVDPSAEDLEQLRAKFPEVTALEGSIYDLSCVPAPPDLIICCEVLEHLDEPDRALGELRRLVADHPARLLLSVPHEPWFQLSNLMRGKNLVRLGNDIEHINRWGRRGFARLLRERFTLIETATSYPWQLALVAPA